MRAALNSVPASSGNTADGKGTKGKQTRSQSPKNVRVFQTQFVRRLEILLPQKNKKKGGWKEVTAKKCAIFFFRSSSCTDWKHCEVKDKNESQHKNVRHDSFVYDSFTPCLYQLGSGGIRQTRAVWHASLIRDMTHRYVTRFVHMWHDSFTHDVTHSYVSDVTHLYVTLPARQSTDSTDACS